MCIDKTKILVRFKFMHIDQYELYMATDSLGQDLCCVITGSSFRFQMVSVTCSNSDTSSSLEVWGFVSLDQRFSSDCWHFGPENSFLVHCRIFSLPQPTVTTMSLDIVPCRRTRGRLSPNGEPGAAALYDAAVTSESTHVASLFQTTEACLCSLSRSK